MEQETQNKFLLPAAIVVAGAFIAVAVYFGGGSGGVAGSGRANQAGQPVINISPVTERDHIIGSRNAAAVVIEYSDIECPFCKVFHYTMKEVVSHYQGDVAWVYRHFPIAQLHANATREAEATECAAELGGNEAFWRYLDLIFERTNSNDSLDLALLPEMAAEIGLNKEAFSTCLSSGRHSEYVRKSVEEAVKAGARGTPYSVIITKDGRKEVINGAEPFESVRTKIDALIR